MQAVVKTPRIDIRITGEISEKLIKALEEECVDAQEISWYKMKYRVGLLW